jgi:hypothetical protein
VVSVRRLLAGCFLLALAIEGLAILSWLDLALPGLARWLALWGLLITLTAALGLHIIRRREPPGEDDGDGGSRRPDDDPPPWWPQFEREFADYMERTSDAEPERPAPRAPAAR